MHLRFQMSAESMGLLTHMKGDALLDIQVTEHGGRSLAPGKLEASFLKFKLSRGADIFISITAIDVEILNYEVFVLCLDDNLNLRRWPGGPSVEWRSVEEAKLKVSGRTIEDFAVITTPFWSSQTSVESIDKIAVVEDSLALFLSGGYTLVVKASEVPTVLELWYEQT